MKYTFKADIFTGIDLYKLRKMDNFKGIYFHKSGKLEETLQLLERETERQRETERETERQRERETERDRERHRERVVYRERDLYIDR